MAISRRSPTYLVRNPYSYCFRMAVPKDLQNLVGRKELRYSLKTDYLSGAKLKARIVAGQIQLLFQCLRRGGSDLTYLKDSEIQELVAKFMKRLIEKYNKPAVPKELADEWDSPPFSDQDGLAETVEFMEEIKEDFNLKLQTGNYSVAERKADRLLDVNRLSKLTHHRRPKLTHPGV